jgi:hypothetical protein
MANGGQNGHTITLTPPQKIFYVAMIQVLVDIAGDHPVCRESTLFPGFVKKGLRLLDVGASLAIGLDQRDLWLPPQEGDGSIRRAIIEDKESLHKGVVVAHEIWQQTQLIPAVGE